MGILELSTILITLAAVFTLINIRLLKLPQTIGLMILALFLSIIVAVVGVVFPQVFETVSKTTALACQNFMMALVAEGFDSCPMEGFDEKRIKKMLKLNWQSHVVMIFGIGEAASNGVYSERFRVDDSLVIKEI